MTVLRSGSATDVGRVRAVNEDHVLVATSLYVIADGMGGHAGGEVAARLAVETVRAAFERAPDANGLLAATEKANELIFQRGRDEQRLRGMGTTIVAAALIPGDHGDDLILANVGDSRAYRFRDGRIEQLTTDHSVAEELVARGELTEAEAAFHPHRHILTRALGVSPDVDIDAWKITPRRGDRFLLCTDGLTNEVTSDRIEGVLGSTPDPQKAADTLVRLANEHGGSDNITVVILDVVVGEEDLDGDAVDVVGATDTDAHVGDSAGLAESSGPAIPAGPAGPAIPAVPADVVPITASAIAFAAFAAGRAGVVHAEEQGDLTGVFVTDGGEVVAADGSPAAGPPKPRRQRGPRVFTIAFVVFFVVLAAIGAGAYGAVRWYVEHSYFVTVDGNQVVIDRGRPGGFLGFSPQVAERTGVVISDVLSYEESSLKSGVEEPTLDAARAYVRNLVLDACNARQSGQVIAPYITAPGAGTSTTTATTSAKSTSSSSSSTSSSTSSSRPGGASSSSTSSTRSTTTSTQSPYLGPSTTSTTVPSSSMARCPSTPQPTVSGTSTTSTSSTSSTPETYPASGTSTGSSTSSTYPRSTSSTSSTPSTSSTSSTPSTSSTSSTPSMSTTSTTDPTPST